MDTSARFRFALLRCARLLSDEMNAVLETHHLNYSLWQSLVIIQLNGQCSALEIAQELRVSKPAITKRLNVLFDMQLIEQSPSQDKRQKVLKLSTQGQKLFNICCEKIDALERQLLQDFPVDELNQAHNFVLSLMHTLQSRKEQQYD